MGETLSNNVLPFGRKTPPFERRRYDRVAAHGIRPRPGGNRLEILDLSQRGMAIKAVHPFSVGGNYLFELLEDDRSLIVEGKVCWCERQPEAPGPPQVDHDRPVFRTGVSFVGIQHQAQAPLSGQPLDLPASASPRQESDEQILGDRIDRLQRAARPDEAAELLLEILSVDFIHLVLFRLQGEEVKAWMGRGPTLVPDRLMKLRLRVDQASIFLHLTQGGSFFYGKLPAMFAHLELLRCWNGSLQRECVLFPIRIKDRLVAVLYADAGDQTLLPQHLAALREATDMFTRSLIDQILSRKTRAEDGHA